MNKKTPVDKLVEEALHSLDNVKRATPGPFLLTRINARLNRTKENMWEKAVWFIGKPMVAIPGLLLLIFINVTVIVLNRPDPFAAITEQSSQAPSDEFSYTVAGIYDIENSEP